MKRSARKQGTLTTLHDFLWQLFFHVVLVLNIYTTIGIPFCIVGISFSTYLQWNWIFLIKDEMLEKRSVNMHSSHAKISQILYEQQFSPLFLDTHACYHSLLVIVLYASPIKILNIMQIYMCLWSFLKYVTKFVTHLRGR